MNASTQTHANTTELHLSEFNVQKLITKVLPWNKITQLLMRVFQSAGRSLKDQWSCWVKPFLPQLLPVGNLHSWGRGKKEQVVLKVQESLLQVLKQGW